MLAMLQVHFDKPSSVKEIKEGLEGSDPATKVQAMQKAIMMLLNGEQLPGMFITILQYVLPSEDHTIQKLLLLYLVKPSSSLFSSDNLLHAQLTGMVKPCTCV